MNVKIAAPTFSSSVADVIESFLLRMLREQFSSYEDN